MGSETDKMKHAAEDMKGRLKEATGNATGDEQMAAEGKTDQVVAAAKKKADEVKDRLTATGQKLIGKAKDKADAAGGKDRDDLGRTG